MDKKSQEKDKTIRFLKNIDAKTYQIMQDFLEHEKADYVNQQKKIVILYEDILIIKTYKDYFQRSKGLTQQIKQKVWEQITKITKKADSTIKDRMNKRLSHSNNEQIVSNIRRGNKVFVCQKISKPKEESVTELIEQKKEQTAQKRKERAAQHFKAKFDKDEINYFHDETYKKGHEIEEKDQIYEYQEKPIKTLTDLNKQKTPQSQKKTSKSQQKDSPQQHQQLDWFKLYKEGRLPKIHILYNVEDKDCIIYNQASQLSQNYTKKTQSSAQRTNNKQMQHDQEVCDQKIPMPNMESSNQMEMNKKDQDEIQGINPYLQPQRHAARKTKKIAKQRAQESQIKELTYASGQLNIKNDNSMQQIGKMILQANQAIKKTEKYIIKHNLPHDSKIIKDLKRIKDTLVHSTFAQHRINAEVDKEMKAQEFQEWIKSQDEVIYNFIADPQEFALEMKCLIKNKSMESVEKRLIELQIEMTESLQYGLTQIQKMLE